MHKLTRTTEPQELVQARADGLQHWDHFPQSAKKVVRDKLLLMQNFRCAYCECVLRNDSEDGEREHKGHIEHFKRKSRFFYPELTFIWGNLFYSCSKRKTCGRHKDCHVKSKEQYCLLIDPCRDNPEDFLVFDDRGRVSARSDLSISDKRRAEFTIDAFQLNDPDLIKTRKDYLKYYEWLEKYPNEYINSYLSEIKDEPFITAIYHYFGKRVVS